MQLTIDDEFARRMAVFGGFETEPHLAVAVSGGADSIALCLLANTWAEARGGKVIALTIDHGIREESLREARQVGEILKPYNIKHLILTWNNPKPTSAIQESARFARYDLLLSWCKDNGILHLLTGHHQGDQLETLLFRRDRESGPDGLAGMAAFVETPFARILRPFEGFTKKKITNYLKLINQPWIEDPSNEDPKYTRNILRRSLALMSEAARYEILQDAQKAAEARAGFENSTNQNLPHIATLHPLGCITLDKQGLLDCPKHIAVRILRRALGNAGTRHYPARQKEAERLYEMCLPENTLPRTTSSGCVIRSTKTSLEFTPETANLEDATLTGAITPWGQYFVTSNDLLKGANLTKITPKILQGFEASVRETVLKDLPPDLKVALPCIISPDSPPTIPKQITWHPRKPLAPLPVL